MRRNLLPVRRLRPPTARRPIRQTFRPTLEWLETRLAPANVPVLSGHYDGLLSGANTQETTLTAAQGQPGSVNPTNFGKLFDNPTFVGSLSQTIV